MFAVEVPGAGAEADVAGPVMLWRLVMRNTSSTRALSAARRMAIWSLSSAFSVRSVCSCRMISGLSSFTRRSRSYFSNSASFFSASCSRRQEARLLRLYVPICVFLHTCTYMRVHVCIRACGGVRVCVCVCARVPGVRERTNSALTAARYSCGRCDCADVAAGAIADALSALTGSAVAAGVIVSRCAWFRGSAPELRCARRSVSGGVRRALRTLRVRSNSCRCGGRLVPRRSRSSFVPSASNSACAPAVLMSGLSGRQSAMQSEARIEGDSMPENSSVDMMCDACAEADVVPT